MCAEKDVGPQYNNWSEDFYDWDSACIPSAVYVNATLRAYRFAATWARRIGYYWGPSQSKTNVFRTVDCHMARYEDNTLMSRKRQLCYNPTHTIHTYYHYIYNSYIACFIETKGKYPFLVPPTTSSHSGHINLLINSRSETKAIAVKRSLDNWHDYKYKYVVRYFCHYQNAGYWLVSFALRRSIM